MIRIGRICVITVLLYVVVSSVGMANFNEPWRGRILGRNVIVVVYPPNVWVW